MATMAEIRERFGALLKQHRLAQGLTQRELEEKVPFTYSHLSRMESAGRNPPDQDGVIAIAEALNANVSEFLLAAGYAAEGPLARTAFQVLTGTGPGEIPPTDGEQRIMDEVARIPGLGFPQLSEPGFWRQAPENRRETFLLMEQGVEAAKRFYRDHPPKAKEVK